MELSPPPARTLSPGPGRARCSLAARASLAISGGGLLLGVLASLPGLGPSAATAAVMGGPKARPYDESVQVTRKAAEAVLARSGAESCLRGKLTNALLGLTASCAAAGQRNALCELADRAVVQLHWPLTFMDDTSRQLLELIDRPGA